MASMRRVGPVLVLIGVMATPLAFAQPLFPQPIKFFPGDPAGTVVVDINDDGLDDLIVSGQDTIQVHLGNGDGTFTTLPNHSSEDCPWHPAIADFDSDGNLDLAVSKAGNCPTSGGGGISILMGNGDGTFGPETDYEMGLQLLSVTLGDFNGDDVRDLIGMAWSDGQLLLGNGDGTFASTLVPGGNHFPAVADFDGNGLDDYAHSGNSSNIMVRLSNGDGTFTLLASYAVGDQPGSVTAGDVNDDTILDLVVTNEESNDVSVLFGNGDGTFDPEQRYSLGVPAEDLLNPWHVVIDDLDGDGLQDLIVNNWWSSYPQSSLMLLYGTGGGQFGPPVAGDRSSGFGYWATMADFDGDGVEDLARTCMFQGYVSWLFGDGRGAFVTKLQEDLGSLTRQIAVDDLDGDGRLDLVTANEGSNDVSVLLADGAGSFALQQRFCVVDAAPPCPAGSDPSALVIDELTGDAYPDLAVTNTLSNTVSILAGDGTGSFSHVSTVSLPFAAMSPSSIAAGDLDNDDDGDLLVVGEGSNRLAVFLGNGDGTFTPPAGSPSGLGTDPGTVAVARLDGDDIPDVVVANRGSNNVTVLLGDGDGTFTPVSPVVAGTEPMDVTLGDVDGDQIRDMAVANDGSDDLHVFLGIGDGSFGSPTVVPLRPSPDIYVPSAGPYTVSIVDLDGDGLQDLTAHGKNQSVFVGHGDGTFDVPDFYASASGGDVHPGGGRFAAGDFNLDGRLDLVSFWMVDPDSFAVILLNQSGPDALTFEPDRVTLAWPAVTGAQSYDVYRGDMPDLVDADDDGLPDGGYGSCMTSLDDDPRDTFFEDPDVPSSAGTGYFYLIDVVHAGGYSGLGTTSAGLERTPQAPCP